MIRRPRGRRGSSEARPGAQMGKVVGMRGASMLRVALALVLIAPLAGACKKKGVRPGEAGAGAAGLGEEGLGGSSLERSKRGIGPEEGGILGDVHFAYDSYEIDGSAPDVLARTVHWLRPNS